MTLTSVDDVAGTFSVMLIQHTQEKITLARKELGAKVNVEADMVGKYVEKSVVAALGGSGSSGIRAMVEKVELTDAHWHSVRVLTPMGDTKYLKIL